MYRESRDPRDCSFPTRTFDFVRHEGCCTAPLRARRNRDTRREVETERSRNIQRQEGEVLLISLTLTAPVTIVGPQHHGDERAVRGDRQGLRPAILRDVRRPGAKAEPHKHVQCKARAIPSVPWGRRESHRSTSLRLPYPVLRLTDITFSRRKHPL